MTVSLAKASVKLGKALAPRKPARLTFETVRKALAARGVTIRANEWGEYRINLKGGAEETAAYVSRSHDRIETLQECLAEGNAMADFAERAARVPCHAARLESAMAAVMTPPVEPERRQWRLGSSPIISAPGIVAMAIDQYAFPANRRQMLALITSGWGLPDAPARALLSKAVPYTLDGETVVFEVTA